MTYPLIAGEVQANPGRLVGVHDVSSQASEILVWLFRINDVTHARRSEGKPTKLMLNIFLGMCSKYNCFTKHAIYFKISSKAQVLYLVNLSCSSIYTNA